MTLKAPVSRRGGDGASVPVGEPRQRSDSYGEGRRMVACSDAQSCGGFGRWLAHGHRKFGDEGEVGLMGQKDKAGLD
jgi:hypothetical protein